MSLYILGAGGFAAEVAYVIDCDMSLNFNRVELLYLTDDESAWGSKIVKGTVVGSIEKCSCDVGPKFFLPAVGSPKLKQKLVERAIKCGMEPFVFVRHTQSFVGDAEIGHGSIICSMCSITTNVKIGNYVNVNLNCTIGHDAIIEDYVNLSPHCTISGKVHIKEGCDLGSAATILPGITVGEHSVIGAGCVITKDVEPYSLMVGVPGKKIKNLRE